MCSTCFRHAVFYGHGQCSKCYTPKPAELRNKPVALYADSTYWGESGYKKRLANREKIIKAWTAKGRKNIKPSQIRHLGA